MIRKTVTYEDFNGNERTEECYFNISNTELMKMDAFSEGGMLEELKRIVQNRDTKEVMLFFEKLLKESYGVKSPDGRNLMKSPDILARFMSSPAYDKIFIELMTDAEAAAKFIDNVLPTAEGKMVIPQSNTQQVLQDFVDRNATTLGQVVEMPSKTE